MSSIPEQPPIVCDVCFLPKPAILFCPKQYGGMFGKIIYSETTCRDCRRAREEAGQVHEAIRMAKCAETGKVFNSRRLAKSRKEAAQREAAEQVRREEVAQRAFPCDASNYERALNAYLVDQEAYKRFLDGLPKNKRYLLERDAAGSYTLQEWQALCAKYDHRCLKCGAADRPLTVDHIIPLSCGGSHRIDNLQPLCRPCNSTKGVKRTDYRPNT